MSAARPGPARARTAPPAARRRRLCTLLLAALAPQLVGAAPDRPLPTLQLAGRMGARALLLIDGRAHTLAVGASAEGVRLISWQGDEATVEIDGQRRSLRLGATPARLDGDPEPFAPGRRIRIPVGSGGHFRTTGTINGRSTRFLVDTGATLVSMGRAEAERLGLDLAGAPRGMAQTANGPVPMHTLVLSSVRIGEVQIANVGAAVLPQAMPYVLLGNSYLSRFQMRHEGDGLWLELR